jgi:betaine-aldehyde dehydrogenase
VEDGVAEGAVVRCGGTPAIGGELIEGFFYRATVLDERDTKMQVVQAESFGPVMTVERFTDEADAVRIANDIMYGRIGRKLGRAGLAEHRETKHIWQNVRPEAQRWFSG